MASHPGGGELFRMPARRSRRWVPLVAALGLVGVAAAAALFARRDPPEGTAAPVMSAGGALLKVTVAPADADVVVDGVPVDARAPLLLAPGLHSLTVTRQGYRRVDRAVELRPGEPVEVRVTLARAEDERRSSGPARPRAKAAPARAPARVEGAVYLDFKAGP